MRRYFLYLVLFISASCSSPQEKASGNVVSMQEQVDQTAGFANGVKEPEKEKNNLLQKKQLHDLSFRFHFMEATDFQRRKGEKLSKADLKQLSREQVMLFEIEHEDLNVNILEKQLAGMDENELVNYFASTIQRDLMIMQGSKEVSVNGVYYESVFGASNKIRCIFYITGLKLDRKFDVLFNDKVFGNDLIKYNFN